MPWHLTRTTLREVGGYNISSLINLEALVSRMPQEAEGGDTELCTASKVKKTKRGKKKKKDKDLDSAMGLGPAHRASVPEAGPVYATGMFDDSWADRVGDGISPCALADAAPFPAAMPASSGGSRRVLAQRVSRERTPPPQRQRQFVVGDFVEINGLEKRTELYGSCGSVIEGAADDGRFAVRLVSAECIRAKESNLTLVAGSETKSLPTASTRSHPPSSLHVNAQSMQGT